MGTKEELTKIMDEPGRRESAAKVTERLRPQEPTLPTEEQTEKAQELFKKFSEELGELGFELMYREDGLTGLVIVPKGLWGFQAAAHYVFLTDICTFNY